LGGGKGGKELSKSKKQTRSALFANGKVVEANERKSSKKITGC